MFDMIEVIYQGLGIIPPDPGGCACCMCDLDTSADRSVKHASNIEAGGTT